LRNPANARNQSSSQRKDYCVYSLDL